MKARIDTNIITGKCDSIIEWCFYTLLVAVTFSTSLVEIASTLLITAWVVKVVWSRDTEWTRPAPVRILGALLFWTLLSCFNSDYPRESFRGVFKVVEYSLIFIVVATTLKADRVKRRFVYVLTGGAVLACLNGFYQYFTGEGLLRHRDLIVDDYLRRISSSFVHPNDFGVYLLVVTIVLIAMVSSSVLRNRYRTFLAGSLVLCVVSLFLTKSRGAWISFSAAFLTLGAIKSRKLVAIFIALLLVVFIMLPYTVQERIFGLTNFESGTTWERIVLWKGTVNMIKEHPVLGFGVNTYSRNFPDYKPDEYWDARYCHNCYLHMASEIGIVGALIFIIFIVMVLVQSLSGISDMRPGTRKDLSRGLFAALVGVALNSMVDTHLYSVNLAVLFHLLLGFCFAVTYHAQER